VVLDDAVYSIAISGTRGYVGGDFLNAGGASHIGVASFDTSANTVRTWNPDTEASVRSLAISNGTVIAGGTFDYALSAPLKSLAIIDAALSNVTAPSAPSGSTLVGSTLTSGGDGTWSGIEPISYTTTWLRCESDSTNCSTIDGATASTYVLTAADIGFEIRTSIRATDYLNSESIISAATEPVTTCFGGSASAPTVRVSKRTASIRLPAGISPNITCTIQVVAKKRGSKFRRTRNLSVGAVRATVTRLQKGIYNFSYKVTTVPVGTTFESRIRRGQVR
jgi:hypothetical protein